MQLGSCAELPPLAAEAQAPVVTKAALAVPHLGLHLALAEDRQPSSAGVEDRLQFVHKRQHIRLQAGGSKEGLR